MLSEGSEVVSSVLQQVTVFAVAANSYYCQSVDIGDSSTRFCAGVMPNGGKGTEFVGFKFKRENLTFVIFRYLSRRQWRAAYVVYVRKSLGSRWNNVKWNWMCSRKSSGNLYACCCLSNMDQ